jgi:hypothetical protein
MDTRLVCSPRTLPPSQHIQAAEAAIRINPANRVVLHPLAAMDPAFAPTRERIAAVTQKYWHSGGVKLTVGFLDNPAPALRARIVQHMNAWAQSAKVQFTETQVDAQVRIARVAGDGYWSYIGTDILQIGAGEPTMNLDSFTMDTPESEYHRVVRHETGHSMGFVHEHMRAELVSRIDVQKAIAYFAATQGWTEQEVRNQVLTPLDESTLTATGSADPNSIMCYQIPGAITIDQEPIVGGLDIDPSDFAFAAKLYPK